MQNSKIQGGPGWWRGWLWKRYWWKNLQHDRLESLRCRLQRYHNLAGTNKKFRSFLLSHLWKRIKKYTGNNVTAVHQSDDISLIQIMCIQNDQQISYRSSMVFIPVILTISDVLRLALQKENWNAQPKFLGHLAYLNESSTKPSLLYFFYKVWMSGTTTYISTKLDMIYSWNSRWQWWSYWILITASRFTFDSPNHSLPCMRIKFHQLWQIFDWIVVISWYAHGHIVNLVFNDHESSHPI